MNKVIDEKNGKLLYIGAAAAYFVLLVIAYIFGDKFGSVQEYVVFVSAALGIGLCIYMKNNEYDVSFKTKVHDKKPLCIIYILIVLMLVGNRYTIDTTFSENVSANIWFLAEAIAVAFGMEVVMRAFGGYCFQNPSIKEEILMVVLSGVLCVPAYISPSGIVDSNVFVGVAVGFAVATMMTGFYLRYKKLGVNIILNFFLYYLVNFTKVNSTTDTLVMGSKAPIVIGLAAVAMFGYGCVMLRIFNREGIFDDSEYLKEEEERVAQFREAFMDNKDRYEEKVEEKAAPTVEARREKYYRKLEQKALKKLENDARKGKLKIKK